MERGVCVWCMGSAICVGCCFDPGTCQRCRCGFNGGSAGQTPVVRCSLTSDSVVPVEGRHLEQGTPGCPRPRRRLGAAAARARVGAAGRSQPEGVGPPNAARLLPARLLPARLASCAICAGKGSCLRHPFYSFGRRRAGHRLGAGTDTGNGLFCSRSHSPLGGTWRPRRTLRRRPARSGQALASRPRRPLAPRVAQAAFQRPRPRARGGRRSRGRMVPHCTTRAVGGHHPGPAERRAAAGLGGQRADRGGGGRGGGMRAAFPGAQGLAGLQQESTAAGGGQQPGELPGQGGDGRVARRARQRLDQDPWVAAGGRGSCHVQSQ